MYSLSRPGPATVLGASFLVLTILAAKEAQSGTIGTTTMPIACGTKIAVDATTDGQTLTLDPSDPILNGTCPDNGLTIQNSGKNAINQFFSVDCGTNQAQPITGTASGTGVTLKGPNLALFNCYVSHFAQGIVSDGDGADIEDSQAQDAVADGFVVKAAVSIRNQNLVGITFTGNRAIHNGGFGFDLKANAISGGTGSFFNGIAERNALGGFLVEGDGNALSGNEAFDNGGPGFQVVSKSCCSGSFGQSFDTAIASSNKGPGIIYIGRDDGSNCVGGTGVACTGGVFFPAGFDTTPGSISAADNGGSCPPGTLPDLAAEGVCPIVLGRQCSQKVLDACP
jgi:hypothetical protein